MAQVYPDLLTRSAAAPMISPVYSVSPSVSSGDVNVVIVPGETGVIHRVVSSDAFFFGQVSGGNLTLKGVSQGNLSTILSLYHPGPGSGAPPAQVSALPLSLDLDQSTDITESMVVGGTGQLVIRLQKVFYG